MLRDDHPSSLKRLETLWRLRLEKAAARHTAATEEFRKVVDELGQGLTPPPDGFLAIRQAIKKEAAARDEHMRVLRIVTGLILYGKALGSDSES
jgi:hypothetical protein